MRLPFGIAAQSQTVRIPEREARRLQGNSVRLPASGVLEYQWLNCRVALRLDGTLCTASQMSYLWIGWAHGAAIGACTNQPERGRTFVFANRPWRMNS